MAMRPVLTAWSTTGLDDDQRRVGAAAAAAAGAEAADLPKPATVRVHTDLIVGLPEAVVAIVAWCLVGRDQAALAVVCREMGKAAPRWPRRVMVASAAWDAFALHASAWFADELATFRSLESDPRYTADPGRLDAGYDARPASACACRRGAGSLYVQLVGCAREVEDADGDMGGRATRADCECGARAAVAPSGGAL
jgi:hypothetical protein